MECVIDTNRDLEKLGHYWQMELGLIQWDIRFMICPPSEMRDKCQAQVDYQRAGLTAIVKVLNHEHWDNSIFEQDMEVSLVHEMLHILNSPVEAIIDESSAEGIAMEQIIQTTARALVSLKREARHG